MWPGIPATFQNLPVSDCGTSRQAYASLCHVTWLPNTSSMTRPARPPKTGLILADAIFKGGSHFTLTAKRSGAGAGFDFDSELTLWGLYLCKACKLTTLHYRQIRGDMIETYQIISGKYESEITPRTLAMSDTGTRITRGNDLRLHKSRRATVCKTVRPMLSDRCLSVLSCLSCPVLSVCNVRALWPNDWTDQDETWHAGRPRPWPHCVRWGPSPLPSKGGGSPFPIFGPFLLWPNGCMH